MDNRMFCFQCEQTAGCAGCTGKAGVCGKTAEVAELQDQLTGALVGLSRAVDNAPDANEGTWRLMIEGLFTTVTNVSFNEKTIRELIDQVHEEKARLVPGCSGCGSRCGRNDDYDMNLLWNAQEDIRSLKSLILFGVRGMAAYAHHAMMLGYADEEVNRFFAKALFAVGEDWDMDALLPIVMEVGEKNLKCMALLDKANTESYGTPAPATVPLTVEKGPFIVITGHDLHDLKLLLEQTAGKGGEIQLTDAIAKQFDVDRYKAGRLVYTETAYYSAIAEKQGFKDLGVEKVEIIGTLDGSTCSICGQLDGKEIPLAQYEPGVTVPPFHPRCRCTTAPVIPEDFADGLRIARDEDGEEYYLPAGTKWTEWKSRQKPDTSTFQSLNLEPEPVTMQAVAKIKAFDCDTLDAAKQRQLQNAHKRLLMEASKQPLGVEVGRVFDLNMQPLTQTLAGSPEGHTVGLPDFQNDYIATHTHPDSNIFSPKDLQSFVHRPHLKLLTAVGHDSTIYAIEKTSTFDRSAADILVTDLGISADEIAAMFHQEELSYEEAVQSLNFIVRNCISELVGYGLNFYELQ